MIQFLFQEGGSLGDRRSPELPARRERMRSILTGRHKALVYCIETRVLAFANMV